MSKNDERIQRAKKKAHGYDQYSGCSQSVLLSLQEEFGIGNDEVFKATTVMSGGIARRGETCGAIIGALMALNLLIGREKMEETEPKFMTPKNISFKINKLPLAKVVFCHYKFRFFIKLSLSFSLVDKEASGHHRFSYEITQPWKTFLYKSFYRLFSSSRLLFLLA